MDSNTNPSVWDGGSACRERSRDVGVKNTFEKSTESSVAACVFDKKTALAADIIVLSELSSQVRDPPETFRKYLRPTGHVYVLT